MEADHTTTPTTTTKPVTVEVPEDRVAEFYAVYARFLAGRRGAGRGHRRHHHDREHGHGPGRCRPHDESADADVAEA